MTLHTIADKTEQTAKITPPLSLCLAYAAMIPPVIGAAFGCLAPRTYLVGVNILETLYCGALLCFFAGVRRGLSFRQTGGPAFAQIAGMVWLFSLGVFTLILAAKPAAMLLPIIGFLSMIPLDQRATITGQAPRYFGRLRRIQMWLPAVSLAALLLRVMLTPPA